MMPVVAIRREDPTDPARIQLEVCVRDGGVGENQDARTRGRRPRAQQELDDRHGDEQNRRFEGVVCTEMQRTKMLKTVVRAMPEGAPHPRKPMLCSMQPVPDQLAHEERDENLEDKRPVSRP